MPLPFLAAAGIGAGVGAIANMFGESEEEKRNRQRREMIAGFLKEMERNRKQASDEKMQSNRDLSSNQADRRQAVNQKLTSEGFSPIGSVASNEKDLIAGNIHEKDSISNLLAKMNSQVQSEVDQTNAGMETEPDMFSRALSGGIKGFNMGSDIFGAATNMINPLDDTQKKKQTGDSLESLMDYTKKRKLKTTPQGLELPY